VKFSFNWIREFVPGLKLSPPELARLITMKTAECESCTEFAPHLARVVAARVLSVEPVPGGHNVVALVDAGPLYGRRQVVCGAPNCRPGIVTAYVPAGVRLGSREIVKATIAGVESDGMLASGAELEINRDQAGIVECEAMPGDLLPGCAPDYVFEVDNKSLTHRPDLWGHHGLAREVAAITGERLYDPSDISLLPAPGNDWNVEILDYDLCPRYSALVFDNVRVGTSPLWVQARLEAIGLNPISNIVDVTNLLLAGLPQPMHAFDADKLHGRTIFVRRANEGEILAALNGESYTLEPSNLVIADAAGAVALAGVIGGADSAIGPETTRIVLESANFEAACIRRTSSSLKLRTDASMRFEKAQDPVNTMLALARAMVLLAEVCPGIRLVGGVVDNWRGPAPARVIDLPLKWVARKLGRPVDGARIRRILTSLEFGVAPLHAGVFSVTVPTWRATKDVTIKEDLLEEIGRMVGYDTIPAVAPLQPATHPWINRPRQFQHEVRELCAAQGFTEVQNYSFISEDLARRFGFDPAAHLHVVNPISSEQSLMRTSLLPGLHRNLLENAKRFDEFRLFEIGYEIHKRDAGVLPEEIPHLMAALYSKGDGAAALFELKRLAECLMPGCEALPAAARGYEHPARAASIHWRGVALGRLFELHPTLLEIGRGAFLDIDLGALLRLGAEPKKYTPLQRFPSSAFDLSVVTGLHELSGLLRQRIQAAAGPCCERVEYLYSYRGKPLPEDRQSLTYRVTLSAPDRTLSSDDLGAVRASLIDVLRAAGYELRL
jgi:phenylalanyl-tRNA synthetase beta chain